MNVHPLKVVADHLGVSVELVARDNDEHVVYAGAIPCLSFERSDAYIAAKEAEREAQRRRDAEDRAAKKAAPNPMKERVKAIQERQQQLGHAPEGVGAALGVMLAADGTQDAVLDRAAADRAEMAHGRLAYHRLEK